MSQPEIFARASDAQSSVLPKPARRRGNRSGGFHTPHASAEPIAGQALLDSHITAAGSDAASNPTPTASGMQRRKKSADQPINATPASTVRRRGRHIEADTHTGSASPQESTGQSGTVNQATTAREGRGHTSDDIHTPPAPPQAIRELYRQRQDLLKAEMGLTLRIRAICRRFCDGSIEEADKLYDAMNGKGRHEHAGASTAHCQPIVAGRDVINDARKTLEKRLSKIAEQHPLWEGWAKNLRGLGSLSFAQLIGEIGDPSDYRSPAGIWKRMGVAVIGGERQRRVKDAEQALIHGYSPTRRSLLFVIGDNLLRAKNPEYSALYAERKAIEQGKMPDASKLHIHRRAKRYIEKRLLRALWRAARPGVPRDPRYNRLAATDADARAMLEKTAMDDAPVSSATNAAPAISSEVPCPSLPVAALP